MGMQRQAYTTEELWMEASKTSNKQEVIEIISNLWEKSYTFSLNKMKTATLSLSDIPRSTTFKNKIADIALDICKTRIDAANSIGKQTDTIEEEYQKGKHLIKQGEYEQGFNSIQKTFKESNMLIKGEEIPIPDEVEKEKDQIILLPIILIAFLIIIILIIALKKKHS
jgi:hypothetical protein